MTGKNRALDQLGCELVAQGARGRVVIHADAMKDFGRLEENKRAHLLRIMELWCEGRSLTGEQFNGSEERYRRGSVTVLLGAFKAFKKRLYGGILHIDDQRTFVVVDVDLAKKQQKADRRILNRAGNRALAIAEQLDGLARTGPRGR